MRSSRYGTSVPPAPLDNAFSPAYLAHLREQDDPLTAAEAELAGPWKIDRFPANRGLSPCFGSGRRWTPAIHPSPSSGMRRGTAPLRPPSGDRPRAALLYRGRSRFEGYPLVAVYGEQGPQVAGWLDRCEPRWAEGLHLLEAIVRSPLALATLLEAAGPGAEEQVGRFAPGISGHRRGTAGGTGAARPVRLPSLWLSTSRGGGREVLLSRGATLLSYPLTLPAPAQGGGTLRRSGSHSRLRPAADRIGVLAEIG